MKTATFLMSFLALSAYGQGPLAPPSGSPQPTQKSLQEIWDKIGTLEQENATLRQEVALNQEATVTGLEALFVDQGIELPWKRAQTDVGFVKDFDFAFHPSTGWPVFVGDTNTRLKIWEYDGTDWNETAIIALPDGRVSLDFASGRICAAYLDGTTVKCAYEKADGTFTVEPVGQSNGTNAHLSLAVQFSSSSREIGISYLNASDDLVYASKPRFDSTDPWTTVTVDSAGDVGAHTSLFFDSTIPNITYQDIGAQQLKGARRLNDGSWKNFVLDAATGAGVGTSAVDFGSGVAVAYHNSQSDELMFLTYIGNGSNITITTVDSDGGTNPSLGFTPDGRPAIAYVADGANGRSELKLAVNPSSTTWDIESVSSFVSPPGRAVLDYRQDRRPAIAFDGSSDVVIWHPGLFPSLK